VRTSTPPLQARASCQSTASHVDLVACPAAAAAAPRLPRPSPQPQIDQLLSAREDINASLAGKGKLSVNDFIVKAAALSCKKVPAVNASWMGDFVRQFHNVDVNVAVASPAGLMVPFLRDADKKGLLAISEEVKSLAAKVRRGRLSCYYQLTTLLVPVCLRYNLSRMQLACASITPSRGLACRLVLRDGVGSTMCYRSNCLT
jgi:hypothetical protein